MKENILIDKSIAFASRIIKLHQYLIKTKKETIISKQIVRSGTSIGANINEANYGQSTADFTSKMHIASIKTAKKQRQKVASVSLRLLFLYYSLLNIHHSLFIGVLATFNE